MFGNELGGPRESTDNTGQLFVIRIAVPCNIFNGASQFLLFVSTN